MTISVSGQTAPPAGKASNLSDPTIGIDDPLAPQPDHRLGCYEGRPNRPPRRRRRTQAVPGAVRLWMAPD